MLKKQQMQEIQDLKLRGYTKSEIRTYYEQQGRRPPSRPTISKYYDMDVVPEDPGAKLSKEKAFDMIFDSLYRTIFSSMAIIGLNYNAPYQDIH